MPYRNSSVVFTQVILAELFASTFAKVFMCLLSKQAIWYFPSSCRRPTRRDVETMAETSKMAGNRRNSSVVQPCPAWQATDFADFTREFLYGIGLR